MYCARCGVELSKGAAACPLCGLPAYHPDLPAESGPPTYPPYTGGDEAVSHGGLLFIVTFFFVVPLTVCLLIDTQMNGGVGWSGYVTGGLLAAYAAVCLPLWFRRPSPVVFYPIAVTALLLLALYICLKTGGRWFLPFAFPVGGAALLLGETVIVLMRHTVGPHRHRALFILGGAAVACGALCMLIEFLLHVTFAIPMRWWCLYPLSVLALMGLMLIVTGICRPLRLSLHKRFFI